MSQRAVLEGVPGVVDLHFHLSSGVDGEWRGTFRADDERNVTGMVGKRPLRLETRLEEEARTLPVTVTGFETGGVALFRTRAWSAATSAGAGLSQAAPRGARRTPSSRRPSRRRPISSGAKGRTTATAGTAT
jgi:hypothetical protein